MWPQARATILLASLQVTLHSIAATQSLRRAMTEIRSEEYLI